MSHAGIFFVRRIRTRLYEAKHLLSGRKFELRKMSETNQLWTAHEIKKDKVSKYVFVESRTSKKHLLDLILDRIKNPPKVRVKYTPQAVPLGNTRIRPFQMPKLKQQVINEFKYRVIAETGEIFIVERRAGEWYCTFENDENAQPIASGMQEKAGALLELTYYLDKPLAEMTSDEINDYRTRCFIPRT